MTRRVVYLHGFASSPQSTKARFFRERFEALGVRVKVPQLDEGNFEGLTITGQLRVIEKAFDGEPACLMGSSLGGYLGALYAARHPDAVERLVLLAPAFQFPTRWRERFSPRDLARWKSLGAIPFFHYAFKEQRPLGYGFVEDAAGYEDEPEFRQPALVFHGTRDEVVPAWLSEEFAAKRPNVTLRLVESGHELTDVLEELWTETEANLSARLKL
jgi:pimeloyl-ACP methyl ester carboxylesterase